MLTAGCALNKRPCYFTLEFEMISTKKASWISPTVKAKQSWNKAWNVLSGSLSFVAYNDRTEHLIILQTTIFYKQSKYYILKHGYNIWEEKKNRKKTEWELTCWGFKITKHIISWAYYNGGCMDMSVMPTLLWYWGGMFIAWGMEHALPVSSNPTARTCTSTYYV